MVLVDFQVDGCPMRLHHVCQGEYVVLNDIDFDGAERKICCDCVDKLWGKVKSKTLKKVRDITVYRTKELGGVEEEVEGGLLGGGGDEFSDMPVFYPVGKVSVSSIGSFFSVGSSYKPSRSSLIISLVLHCIQYYFKKKRGGGAKAHQSTGGEGQA